MANNSNSVKENEVKSEIPFLHSTPSSPHLPESHSLAETTLNSSLHLFLEFSMYLPSSSHTTLLLNSPTKGLQSWDLAAFYFFCQESPSSLCVSGPFRTLLLATQNCHLLREAACNLPI